MRSGTAGPVRTCGSAHVQTSDGTRYTVSAVAQPEIDIQLLAKALLGVVEQERKKAQPEPDTSTDT